MALFETLQDNFNDNSLNTSLWSAGSDNGGSVAEANSRFEFTLPSGIGPFGFIQSNAVDYSLINSYVLVQTPAYPHPSVITIYLYLFAGAEDLLFETGAGVLYASRFRAGIRDYLRSVPYDTSFHKWLRIRATATHVYFETSPDSQTWYNFVTFLNDMTLTSLGFFFEAFAGGTFPGPAVVALDNVNTPFIQPEIILTGDGTIVPTPTIKFYVSVDITGESELEAVGVSLADQRAIEKTYLYKVYDAAGTYLGLWDDVITDLNYDHQINTPGSSIEVELARNSDSRVIGLSDLNTTSGEAITTQDSNTLVVASESRNAVGPGSNVEVNYRVQIYVFYGEITDLITSLGEVITTDGDEPIQVNYGAVNGVRKFHGKIKRYVSRYGGNETVLVSIDSLGVELDQYVLLNGANTQVTYTTTDPSTMAKNALDYFTGEGGTVDYDTSSVALTGTTATYTFRLNTILEVIEKSLELAPYDWYWYVGLGDNIVYFQDKPSTASHTFILGKHIKELNLEYSIADMTNVVYFTGGDTGGGSNLFKKYTDSTSITNYGQGLKRITDHRVTLAASADLIAEAEIDRNSIPRYRTSITILDKAYDIEDIKLGQLIAFRNFDNYIDALLLQIVGLSYEPHQVTLQLDSLLPSVSKRVEDLRRNMIELDNVDTPGTPS